MPIAFLPNRSIISLRGADVIEFLQGLISNDARRLLKSEAIYSAMLSPQGKFLHDFFLMPQNEKNTIFLDVATSKINDLLARLKLYRLRSRVEITVENSLLVAAIWNTDFSLNLPIEKSQNFCIFLDPRLPSLGYRIIGDKETILANTNIFNEHFCRAEEYEKLRLSLTIPDTNDMIAEKSLLLECGFEQLHGVDFSKGCYIGQEVTARSKFRGQVKKSLYHVSAQSTLPAIGTQIMLEDKSNGKIVGELRTSFENIGIAIINNEGYNSVKMTNNQFFCAEINVQITPPIWI
jgi:folate-binding protein YgfZ